MRRLLIADGTEEFRLSLYDALKADYQVCTCRSGKQALAMITENPPDILVLDLMLPELDGISLLHTLNGLGIHPVVLATTRFLSDYVTSHINQLGIAYMLLKPCDLRATVNRIHDLSEKVGTPVETVEDSKGRISTVLITLGIPAKLKGYDLLRQSICLVLSHPGQSITKELYPSVASSLGISPTQVERSIRTAIAVGFEKGDKRQWAKFFPAGDGEISRPSNGSFINAIAENLRLQQAEY